jgi:hypothetical protein
VFTAPLSTRFDPLSCGRLLYGTNLSMLRDTQVAVEPRRLSSAQAWGIAADRFIYALLPRARCAGWRCVHVLSPGKQTATHRPCRL